MGLTHHELCFGCGQANLFGLQFEAEPADEGGVAGRLFVKQDHQGRPGEAHPGMVATALEEAMSLTLEAEGVRALPERLEVRLESSAPVGAFLHLESRITAREEGRLCVEASASLRGAEARDVASATAEFVPYEPESGRPPGR